MIVKKAASERGQPFWIRSGTVIDFGENKNEITIQ
jgi:hypothetical protein